MENSKKEETKKRSKLIEDKLEYFLKHTAIKRASVLARELGIDSSNINQWKKRGEIPLKHIKNFRDEHQINPLWWEDDKNLEPFKLEPQTEPNPASPWESYSRTLLKDLESLKIKLADKQQELSELESNKFLFDSFFFKIKFIIAQIKDSKDYSLAIADDSKYKKLILELEKMIKEYEASKKG